MSDDFTKRLQVLSEQVEQRLAQERERASHEEAEKARQRQQAERRKDFKARIRSLFQIGADVLNQQLEGKLSVAETANLKIHPNSFGFSETRPSRTHRNKSLIVVLLEDGRVKAEVGPGPAPIEWGDKRVPSLVLPIAEFGQPEAEAALLALAEALLGEQRSVFG